ncbi:MAG: hypothetical protein PHD95_00270 [Candidatus ainarchaeum sp.]|nr:hypothetical protein [Candidatus ainarchaeum sp.]
MVENKNILIIGILIIGLIVGFLAGNFYSMQEPTALKLCRELNKPANFYGTSTCEASAIGITGNCPDAASVNKITVNCG